VQPTLGPRLAYSHHVCFQDERTGAQQLSDFDFMIQLGDKSMTLRAGRHVVPACCPGAAVRVNRSLCSIEEREIWVSSLARSAKVRINSVRWGYSYAGD
jgi:hypothetical protein